MTASATSEDAWLDERLAAWAGRRLSQIRLSEASVVLDFWEVDDAYTAWLYADELQVRISDACRREPGLQRKDRDAVLALHALLGQDLAAAEVSGGVLRLGFAGGSELLVAPAPHEQAWAVTFEKGGSVCCEPRGVLDIRTG